MTRPPCRSCPWRVERGGDGIEGYALELAEGLAATCPDERGMGPDFGAPLFACHKSRPSEEIVCAGWLAVVGARHPLVRLLVMRGEIDPAALEPGEGWPELHGSFGEFIEKLRAERGGEE